MKTATQMAIRYAETMRDVLDAKDRQIDQLTQQLKAAEEVIEAYTALDQATRAHLVEIKKHTGDPSALPTHKAMEGARARFKAKYTGYIGSNVTHMPLLAAHKEQEQKK